MQEDAIESVVRVVADCVGARLKGAFDNRESRAGLSFWFENYTRGSGPIFSIRPSGLRRHAVSVSFGPYATQCIEHIRERVSAENYSLAYAFFEDLLGKGVLEVEGGSGCRDWVIETGFIARVTLRVDAPHDTAEVSNTAREIMVPFVAALAELIGYEEGDSESSAEFFAEGEMVSSVTRRRERSLRNRFLCLSIHGKNCAICGFGEESVYGADMRSIIEVHHIEPLSEIDAPRPYDPKLDLIPLCPNCHRAIHTRKPAYTPSDIRKMLKK